SWSTGMSSPPCPKNRPTKTGCSETHMAPRKLIVDGKEIEVDDTLSLLQACELAGAEIPRFCYHERLSVAGNCRMCLVEVVGGPPKPTASCAQQVKDLRPGPEGQPPQIKTTTDRKSVV